MFELLGISEEEAQRQEEMARKIEARPLVGPGPSGADGDVDERLNRDVLSRTGGYHSFKA